jgi:hypothetical protein
VSSKSIEEIKNIDNPVEKLEALYDYLDGNKLISPVDNIELPYLVSGLVDKVLLSKNLLEDNKLSTEDKLFLFSAFSLLKLPILLHYIDECGAEGSQDIISVAGFRKRSEVSDRSKMN